METAQFERYRAYLRERAARLAHCSGGYVTKYPGKWIWYCDGCGSEFDSEAQALAPKHEAPSDPRVYALINPDGSTESDGTAAEFRAANAEDAEVLAALGRLERGESQSEIVGLFRMVEVRP